MEDQNLTCSDCQNNFVFSERDQAFYNEKGFSPPKRCKPCRDIKKSRQQGGSGQGDSRPPREERRDDRPKFDATCAECGAETKVPFEPRAGRPVYCRDCFKAKDSVRGGRR